ncbi:hypothetical protein Hanom_Chr03g00203651 [Helianthus anomalus]
MLNSKNLRTRRWSCWLRILAVIASGYLRVITDRLVKLEELAKYMFELGGIACESGRKDGYGEGKAAAFAKEKDRQFDLFKIDCTGNYTTKRQKYEFLEFGILKAIEKLTQKGIEVETLKKVLEDVDTETGGAGTSHQSSFAILPACMPCTGLWTL